MKVARKLALMQHDHFKTESDKPAATMIWKIKLEKIVEQKNTLGPITFEVKINL